jgi:ABC-type hemin transport system ATPase subunit
VIAAHGTPDDVLTVDLLRAAYGIDVDVRRSPVTDSLSVTAL